MKLAVLLMLMAVVACRVEVGPPGNTLAPVEKGERPKGEVMIYTSMYRHVIDDLKPILTETLPDVKVEWLQGGSEKLATRLDAELAAKAPRADLVLTSDPLWYERLRRDGHLAPYASIRALSIPRSLVERNGTFVTSRISTMVIAYNKDHVAPEDAPATFEALFDTKWKGRVTTPDPLGSGTTFTTLAFLVFHYGDEFIDRMKEAETISSGGNSSTLTRLESGEHHVGFVLLENLLAAEKRGTTVKWRLPEEGPVIVPGPIALLDRAPNAHAARAVYDVLLSTKAQTAIVGGLMHSPFEELEPPVGAPALKALLESKYRWTPEFVEKTVEVAHSLRERFARVMGGD